MFAMLALATLTTFTSQQDLSLKFKPGEKLVYEINLSTVVMGLEALGHMPMSFAQKDGKYTVSWPQVEMMPNKGTFQPIKAGKCVITDRGRVITPDAAGQGAMILIQMALPEKPIAVGGTFPIKDTQGKIPLDLTGKLEKMTEKGIAVIVADGMLSAQGGNLALHWESHFDTKRGIFLNGTMSLSQQGSNKVLSSFSYKLIE